MTGAVEVEDLKRKVDLLALIGADTALKRKSATNGGEYEGPCPFCGGRDRLHVQPHAHPWPRWFCRQCTGDPREARWMSAVDYVMRRQNLDFKEACDWLRRWLGAPDRPRKPPHRARPVPRPDEDGPPPLEWQQRAWKLVEHFQETLWRPDGERARRWLYVRYGLEDETVRAWRLGYCPADGRYEGLFVHRGIIIPWWIGDTLWAVKVRLPVPDGARGKYRRVACPGYHARGEVYGVQHWRSDRPDCFVTEGEFDALFLWQLSDGRANVLTLGAKGGVLADRWLPLLVTVRRFWIVTDADGEREAAAYWLDLVGRRGRRLRPPGGHKDITDAWRAGEDVISWLERTMHEYEEDKTTETGADDLDEIFLAGSALLDRLRDRIRRYALYDRLEDAYLAEDREALLAVFSEIAAAVEERKPRQPALWPVE